MIRNSTKKFKERYAYSSAKKLETINADRENNESSLRTVRFNKTQ